MPPPPSAFADALVLTGPTGSGKSAVALELAESIDAEIVSMDSMTVYRGMDIGTAKPTPAELARVRHHLVDVLDPWESGNVAWWLDHAAAACAELRARGKRPLLVGGTPFYLKALLHGLFDGPPTEPEVRLQFEELAREIGNEGLHARLAEVDPKSASRLHPNDVRRVVRALEVHAVTGRPISEFQQTWDSPELPAIPAVVLEWPREELYRRIDSRVDQMLAAGWVDEARRLRNLPRPIGKEAGQALGYREIFAFLDGKMGWDETVVWIKTHTRQFAKRQLTWFRHLPGLVTVPAGTPDSREMVRQALLRPTSPLPPQTAVES